MTIMKKVENNIVLIVNGKPVNTTGCNPQDPLVFFIRKNIGLRGTKYNCDYGCTGACSVILSMWKSTKSGFTHDVISSCSTPLASVHKTNITTIEGIGTSDSPHPLQKRLADCHGVQCGFDSPGVVVSMYGLLVNNTQPTMDDIEKCQVGNISRCSGYRAVLEAFKVFSGTANEERKKLEAGLPEQLQRDDSEAVVFKGQGLAWHRVPSQFWVKELQKNEPDSVVVYGIPHPNSLAGFKTVIDVSRMSGTGNGININKTSLEIMATTTISDLSLYLADHTDSVQSPLIKEMVKLLESIKTPQYRAATAIGDALQSSVELVVFLLAAKANLIVYTGKTKCKIFNAGESSDKSIALDEVVSNLNDVNVRALVIPKISEEEYLMFYGVGGRRANAADSFYAAFNVKLLGNAIKNPYIYVGSKIDNIFKLEDGMKLISGMNVSEWDEKKMANISKDSGIQNVVFKFLTHIKVIANGSRSDIKQLEDDRFPKRTVLSSTQYNDHVTNADLFADDLAPIGKPVPHVAGLNCATGQALFTDDIPQYYNELFFGLVASTVAHARLVSVDSSLAVTLPGVVKFICAKDVPEGKNKFKVFGDVDEDIFADEFVQYEGHPIGAILAESEKIAKQAAALVKVTYEELKPIVSLSEAIETKNIIVADEKANPTCFTVGDVDTALGKSQNVVEGTIKTTRQEHFYEEPHTFLVIPTGEDDEYRVYLPTTNVLFTQSQIASVLGVPFNRILVHTKRVGCSYGGRGCRNIPFSMSVALAAKLTGRPVRSTLTRDQDMRITGQRGEFIAKYKIGITDGKITGAKYQLHKNAGWNSDLSNCIVTTAMVQLDASYEFPTFHVDGTTYKTNTPSNTAMRAFGAPPAHTITENMIYDACLELGLDQVEFRKVNFQRPGYENHYGQIMDDTDVTMGACMDVVMERANYYQVKQEVETFNQINKWKKRGICIIPNKYGIGNGKMFSQGGALVHVYLDGSVLISHGGVECGQGLHTKMLQIVAHELGVPMERIRVSESANDKVPNPIPTGGGVSADLNGPALIDACKQLSDRLAPFREAEPKAPWEMHVGMAFASRINLSAFGYYRAPEDLQTFDPVTKKGRHWWYFVCGAACSLVEIDVLTGEHTLMRTDIVMDVGEAINPAIDVAQIESAFIQGYGYVAMEDTLFGSDGKLLTRGHNEYNIPSIADCPSQFNVSLLKSKLKKPHLLYSSKGIGEPPYLNGVSVYFAIKEAVKAARQDLGIKGKFDLKMPTIPANIRGASGGK